MIDAEAIDHVNLRVPEGRVEEFVEFYSGTLGFEVEDLDAYRAGDRPIFTVRLAETAVIHVSPVPDETFAPPAQENFDHVAVRVAGDAGRSRRRANGRGAVGVSPAGASSWAPRR